MFNISFHLFPFIKIIDSYTVSSSKVSKLIKLKRYSNDMKLYLMRCLWNLLKRYSNEIEISLKLGHFVTSRHHLGQSPTVLTANMVLVLRFRRTELLPNELLPNELLPNELLPNELSPNELSSKKLSFNELSSNELPSNKCSLNKLSLNELFLNEMPLELSPKM